MFKRETAIWPGHATIHEAVRYLASACDGAVHRDGHGFSTDHVPWGHWLADLPDDQWGPRERHLGRQLVWTYRIQLERAGFNPDSVVRDRRPTKARLGRIKALQTGWALDPTGVHQWRWWNGVRWTSNVD